MRLSRLTLAVACTVFDCVAIVSARNRTDDHQPLEAYPAVTVERNSATLELKQLAENALSEPCNRSRSPILVAA
jgi:uncharacterized protein YfcZ (UPF0381/DUF406 family)